MHVSCHVLPRHFSRFTASRLDSSWNVAARVLIVILAPGFHGSGLIRPLSLNQNYLADAGEEIGHSVVGHFSPFIWINRLYVALWYSDGRKKLQNSYFLFYNKLWVLCTTLFYNPSNQGNINFKIGMILSHESVLFFLPFTVQTFS